MTTTFELPHFFICTLQTGFRDNVLFLLHYLVYLLCEYFLLKLVRRIRSFYGFLSALVGRCLSNLSTHIL